MSPIRAAIVPVTPFQQNTSLVWCEKTMKAAFVDPGGEVPKLLDAVRQTGVSVEKILLTHGHLDHAGAAAEISETLGVPIEGPHRDEDWLLAKLEQSAAKYGMKDARGCTPTRWLDDGDTVTVGGLTLDVLHTPGHTPGSQCFHVDGRLVSGDTLFLEGCGRTDLPGSNPADMFHSLRRLASLPDDTIVYPGHRYSQPSSGTMSAIRDTNYVFKPQTQEAWMQWFGR